MEILSQNTSEIQQTIEGVLSGLPIVLVDGDECAYFLIKDLPGEIENFIQTGEGSDYDLHVFPETFEEVLIRMWLKAGFEYSYGTQTIYCMKNSITIKYMRVRNPRIRLCVSFMPWFMLPGRPYPVYIYHFASTNYHSSIKKSLSLSAKATRELFGVSSFHKTTLSRNINIMDDIAGDFDIDKLPPTNEPGLPALSDISFNDTSKLASVLEAGHTPIDDTALSAGIKTNKTPFENKPGYPPSAEMVFGITELLKSCTSLTSLTNACGLKAGRVPDPVRGAKAVEDGLGSISNESLQTGIGNEPARIIIAGETRKEPVRRGGERAPPLRRRSDFVETEQSKQVRLEFIASCKVRVFDAAIKYHRFLC
jgi:hypothetical protein